MTKHWELHECESLPINGVRVIWAMDNIIRKCHTWQLVIQREATETDLMNNHYLEEEGQTIWTTQLEITHCPYCGKKLIDGKRTDFNDYGQFVHFDRTGWHSKKQ